MTGTYLTLLRKEWRQALPMMALLVGFGVVWTAFWYTRLAVWPACGPLACRLRSLCCRWGWLPGGPYRGGTKVSGRNGTATTRICC